jgi:hypothetical protein
MGRRVAREDQDGKADQRTPQAQHGPRKRDREKCQKQEVDRTQTVPAQEAGHEKGHGSHGASHKTGEQGTTAADRGCWATLAGI